MDNTALNKQDIVHIEINNRHSKWLHNSSEDSFYSESNNSTNSTNERCSFHYPVLERWLQMAMKRFQEKTTKYNPLIGQNIAFTFHDKKTTGTTNPYVSAKLMDAAQKLFRTGNNFIVTLYDWDLDVLSVNEIKLIFQSINNSFITQEFSDPLANTEHKAVKTPIEAIIKPVNNQETNENIKMNKKQTIRLNESQFNNLVKKVVKESVKKVLFEERPPFLDSEIAMGEHERNFDFRVTKVIQNCVQSLRDCIIDDEFGEKIDYMFAPKIDMAIRNVLREYGLLN